MINVTKGWPNGHASEASYQILDGQDIVEGDFCVLVDDGSGNPVWRLAISTDAQTVLDNGGQALDTNTSFGYDVRYTGMLPVVRKNYTAQTDRFTPGTLIPGSSLEIDSARPGVVKLHAGGALAVAGTVESYDAEAGILTYSRL